MSEAALNEVAVCNGALILIGQDTITSLDDNVTRAIVCNEHYYRVRNAVLRAYPWNFAEEREGLAKLAEAPTFEFSYAYQLPVDCLRVWRMYNAIRDGVKWKINGRKLLTSESSASIIYTKKIEDPTVWDALFVEAFIMRLGATVAYTLTSSKTLGEKLFKLYELMLEEAEDVDSQEGVIEAQEDADNNALIDTRA